MRTSHPLEPHDAGIAAMEIASMLAQDGETHAERPQPRFAGHSSVLDGGTTPHPALGTSIFCAQHPAMRRSRENDEGAPDSRLFDIGAKDAAAGGRSSARRATESNGKRGPFLLSAKLRELSSDAQAGEGMIMTLGQQMKTPKLRTDTLPNIAHGPSSARGQQPSSDPSADRPYLSARHNMYRVSGYSGGVSAISQNPLQGQRAQVQPYPVYPTGGSASGAIKLSSNRSSRPPVQRSAQTERKGAMQNQEVSKTQNLSAGDIEASHGIKAALDSCRVPLDLAALKGDDDGIRLVNRSARNLNSHRGEAVDHDSSRPAIARANDTANELVVCNNQKVEDTDLVFMSQFESGNLMSAQRTGPQEYDLQLQVDHATTGHTQWFFFCVSNTQPGVQYRFNIINFAKPDSLYTRGQQPLFFSLLASKKEKVGWRRVGKDIRYYRNGRKRNGKALFTLSFLVEFAHAKDKCLFAHCYPYTYSELQDYLSKMMREPLGKQCMQSNVLCTTLGGNECALLTITSPNGSDGEKKGRNFIFLSSRVHPGESNSSWIMKGLLDFLLGPSEEADLLRSMYIFKIIPMLNPDGVINGHYRCNLAGYDLNRHWHDPLPDVHPTIFHAKELIKNLQRERRVAMFCDIHGHSVKHNLFLYGCPRAGSSASFQDQEDGLVEFTNIMHLASPRFSMADSRFIVEKAKEHTGRVVAWRELGIANSFTLEASLCGLGEGKSQCTTQFTCADFEEMGREFGVSLALSSSKVLYEHVKRDQELLHKMLRPPPVVRTSAERRDEAPSNREPTENEAASNLEPTENSIRNAQPGSAHVNGASTPLKSENEGKGAQAESNGAQKHIQTEEGEVQIVPTNHVPQPEPMAASTVEAEASLSGNLTSPAAPAALLVVASRMGSTGNASTPRGMLNAARAQGSSAALMMRTGAAALESRPPVTARGGAGKDSTASGAPIAPTFRYKKSPVLGPASRGPADTDVVPPSNQTPPTVVAQSEEESSSDDERHEEEDFHNDSDGFGGQAPAIVGHFLDDCKDIRKKVIYWGVMQQKKKKSLEARMRDLRNMAPGQKPDKSELAALVSNLNGGQQSVRSLPLCISPMNGHSSPMDPSADSARPFNLYPPRVDSQPLGGAHSHKGSGPRFHLSTQPNSADFSPLARRQRFTTQRVQEKSLSLGPHVAAEYNPVGGFGAHKPVGPQCKFLPIMLGSLRSVPSGTSVRR